MVKAARDPSTTEMMIEFSRRLRIVRLAIKELTGENQGDICRRLGVDQSRWSKWEAGEHPMPKLVLMALCLRYDISGDYMLTGQRAHLRRDLADKIEELERVAS